MSTILLANPSPQPSLLSSPLFTGPRFSRHPETRLVQRRSLTAVLREFFVCFPLLWVIGHKLPVMYFLVWQSILPVVVALLVILISWYLWRRTFKGPSSNTGEEPTASGEKIESPTTAEQKVSKKSTFIVPLRII